MSDRFQEPLRFRFRFSATLKEHCMRLFLFGVKCYFASLTQCFVFSELGCALNVDFP
mgnify:CR=1 FL=1